VLVKHVGELVEESDLASKVGWGLD